MWVKDLANLGELREEIFELPVEGVPEGAVYKGEGVDAKRIGASLLDPPDGVLALVPGDVRIIWIHIRKDVREPALQGAHTIAFRSIRVDESAKVRLRREVMCGRTMQPRWSGLIGNPRMPRAGVIRNGVEHKLHAAAVQALRELPRETELADGTGFDIVQSKREG